jgi:hypothetical protein
MTQFRPIRGTKPEGFTCESQDFLGRSRDSRVLEKRNLGLTGESRDLQGRDEILSLMIGWSFSALIFFFISSLSG